MQKRNARILPALSSLGAILVLCMHVCPPKAIAQTAKADDEEKIYSRLFYGDEIGTIEERLSKSTGDINILSDSDQEGLRMMDPNAPRFPPARLVEIACYSDVVAVVTPIKGVSHVTADKSFVYTDWIMRIDEVLEDSPKAPVSGGKTFLVVSPGGDLRIDGRIVHGKAFGFPEIRAGSKYLLFLTYIPDTVAFKARKGRTFSLAHDVTVADGNLQYEREESAGPDELIRNSRAAVASALGNANCKKRGDE